MDLNKNIALKALQSLDQKLVAAQFKNVQMVIGGGGSMMLHHNYDGMTTGLIPFTAPSHIICLLKPASEWKKFFLENV